MFFEICEYTLQELGVGESNCFAVLDKSKNGEWEVRQFCSWLKGTLSEDGIFFRELGVDYHYVVVLMWYPA